MRRRADLSSITRALLLIAGLWASAAPTWAAEDPQLPDRARSYAEDDHRYRAARQQYDLAVAQVVRERQGAGEDFRASPDYRAAAQAVDDAYRAYTDRKKQVIADTRDKDPRYAELARQAAAVESELTAARADPKTSVERFSELHERKAVFTRQMKAMDDDAMNQAGAADLKQRWNEASKRLADLQSRQRQAVEQSDRVHTALAAVDTAQKAMDEAGIALAGSQAAYADALSLQDQKDEYLRRYPSPYSDSWYWGGWGYGYGGYAGYGAYGMDSSAWWMYNNSGTGSSGSGSSSSSGSIGSSSGGTLRGSR
jgi:hypothetical protein